MNTVESVVLKARVTLLAVCCVTNLLAMAPSHAQSSAAVDTLIEQARSAQSQNEWTRAKNAWDKVLLNDRNHPDALRGIYYFYLQQGALDDAQQALERFSAEHGDSQFIRSMETDRLLVSTGKSALADARRAIQAGDTVAGLALYEISFGREEPNGPVALEYYTTLGGTDKGWDKAEKGLKRLADANPDDSAYALSYAKHLTYNESRRRNGIDLLISLARNSNAKSSAITSLRESIRWIPKTHANMALFNDYLSVVEDDAEISTLLSSLKSSRTPAQDAQLQQGYSALKDDSLSSAADSFQRLLRARPSDPDALAGLGLVQLKQGNFDSAADYLQRAQRANGDSRADWGRSLRTARYWGNVEKARAAISNESLEDAERLMQAALDIDSQEEVGQVQMAKLKYQLGKIDEAEKHYQRAIEINPSSAVALRGLGELYNETSRFDEAKKLALRLNKESEGTSDPVADGIIAQSHVARARSLQKQNELDLAQLELENAHKIQSYNPWIKLELAQLLVKRQRADRADLVMSELETQEPISASALHALAEYAYLRNRHREALAFLERIPSAERTPQMVNTQNRVWMRMQVERSIQFARNNEFGKARRTLGEAENFAGSQPSMAGALATGWIALGEEDRALAIMRTALRLDSDIWLHLQYAGLLLKIQKNKELAQTIAALQSRTDLDDTQRRELSHIEVSFALRLADQYLRDGQYARSYSAINPFIEWEDRYPNVRMMLGRLHQKTGDLDQALASFELILRDHPNHLDARRSAVGLLIDRKRYAEAQALVDEGLEIYPDHPRMVLLAGQLEAARGRPKSALALYKQALLLVATDTPDTAAQQTSFRIPDEEDVLSLPSDNASVLDFLDSQEALQLESVVGLREDILTEIGRVNAITSNYVQLGGELRNRSGDAGLDKLTLFRAPVQLNVGLGNSGRLAVSATAESVSAEKLSLSDSVQARRFGSLSLDTSLPREETIDNSENGVAFGAAYTSRYLSVDVGSTPTDYDVSNTVGGVSLTNAGDRFRVTAELSQRAVEDSVLSYAGRVDPFQGSTWGGVIKTGGNLRFQFDRDTQGFYGNVAGYSLEGDNVASNSMTQFGGGIFWRLKQTQTSQLRLGLDVDALSYDKNLSHFTYGHGGYFSPQSYVNVGVPLEWRGDTGPMQYSIVGKIGFERYEQDEVDYFPNDPQLQTQLEEIASTAQEPLLTAFEGSNETGINLQLSGTINYQLSTRLSIGSTLRIQQSGDFNESQIGLYARYYFSPQDIRKIVPDDDATLILTRN